MSYENIGGGGWTLSHGMKPAIDGDIKVHVLLRREAEGRKEYADSVSSVDSWDWEPRHRPSGSDIIAYKLATPAVAADAPTPAGDSTQATTFHALPVRDLMPQETATGVGDINSDAPGSGARYNSGKAPFELIPLRHIGQSYLTAGGLAPDEEAAAKALVFLGDYQSRRRGIGALYDALVVLGFDGWDECARVFDYGRKKYAAWNWAKGMNWSIPIACAARHLERGILQGEHNDRESNLSHRGHVFCNIVMLLAFADTFPAGDDRPRAGLLAQPREIELA